MKEIALYVVLVVGITLAIWTVGKVFADTVSDYQVINPEPGVKCVVVSRMFNTSVDCWEDVSSE
jgi:hypothetical protein